MAIYFTQNTNNVEDIEQMNNVINKVNKVNTEATGNIGQLTDLNNKAQELSNNIQQALPINTELIKNTELAKAANTNLLATNQEAVSKNTELQASLEKTKEFINGLDGSQNIPQIRMDVTELQNGLKSNQALAYTGSSISADNTLEGRTEGMRIGGRTMYKKADGTYTDTWEEGVTLESFGEAEGNKISILSNGKNLFDGDFEEGKVIDGNGNVVNASSDKLDAKTTKNFIKVIPNKKYVLQGLVTPGYDTIAFYDINRNFINRVWVNPITIPVNCHYIKVVFKNNFQIEEGTQATQYEPYKQDKKDILIKEPLKDDDVLYEDNGQVKVYRPTKQYTFTGDENFQKINVYGDVVRIDFACDDIKPSGYIISNNFAKGIIGKENLECINIHTNSKYVQFQIKLNKLTSPDVEGFKAWLKANPTTIVYQLAEPVTEVVENCVDIDLDTFGEKTYFNILNSLPGTLDFKVPSNIASIVQSTAREVNNIWDVINNLLVPSLIDINKNVALATIKNNLK